MIEGRNFNETELEYLESEGMKSKMSTQIRLELGVINMRGGRVFTRSSTSHALRRFQSLS